MRRDAVSPANVLGGLVVGALVVTLAWATVRDDASAPEAGCAPHDIGVSTTAEFAPVVQAAVDRLAAVDEASCAGYDVTVEPAGVASRKIAAGTDLPDVWIPDSEVWVARTTEQGTGPALGVGPTLASSPVLLAAPRSLAPPTDRSAAQSWQDILSGPLQLHLDGPADSTAGLLVLHAAAAALGGTEQGDRLLTSATIRMSHETASPQQVWARASTDARGATTVAASEQQISQQRAEHPDSPLGAVVPAEGVGALTYPWVVLAEQDQDDATRAAIARLSQSLTGVAGIADRTAAGFRTADGKGDGILSSAALGPTLPDPSTDETDAVLASWDAARADHQILAVVDVAPSSPTSSGDGTRTEDAAAGLQDALDVLPPGDAVGLWAFSSAGAAGEAPAELVPVAPLDADDGDGSSHRDRLLEESADLRSGTGTDLYDTVRHAYRSAQASYRPDAVNAIVLLVGGREEDGLGLYSLLLELQESADPARPVPIYAVGIGPDAYDHELRLISEITGGRHLIAPDTTDVQDIVLDAMLRPYRSG